MDPDPIGLVTALPTRASRRPLRKGNLSTITTSKLEGKLALVTAVATFQKASSTPAIRSAEVKQAESTVDQLSNRPLEEIPTHCDHTIIVPVFARNTQTQIIMGLPPVTPLRNPLIIEQSRETGPFGKVFVTRHQVEPIIHT